MEIAVVGGGAAGMMTALTLARAGLDVTLFEKNEKLGKKLYITGKGRCNLSNACEFDELMKNVVHGGKFLLSALHGFTPEDAMEFFRDLGLELVIQRGGRVFPASEKSSDVIRALQKGIERQKTAHIRLGEEVRSLKKTGDRFEIVSSSGKGTFDVVVIATGGVSYPSTGSTGDGYKFAATFGHDIVSPKPALVALELKEDVSSLEGLSLKNVSLTARQGEKLVSQEFGELLFTKKGISGPIALTTSSYTARLDNVRFTLDLKPALDEKTLDARLVREIDAAKNVAVKNVMRKLLPSRLIAYALKRAGVDGDMQANALTKQDRHALVATLKGLDFTLKSPASFNEAVITSGGVALDGLKPSGESRLTGGLYFVGEVMDVDALTGGFNLQIAWSTAVRTARDIIKRAV